MLNANVYCSFTSTNHFASTTVFLHFRFPANTVSECSSKTICTTAREGHRSPITKTRQDQNIHHHSTQKREPLPNRDTAYPQYPPANKHHLKLSNFIHMFEPNPRISTIISHHVRSYAFNRTPPQLDKTIDQACGSGNRVPCVLAHIW